MMLWNQKTTIRGDGDSYGWVGVFYRLSLEVNEDSSCDLSDEDEEEAGEVL